MRVVIISTFKPFLDAFKIEQTNALKSWKKLRCNPKIIIVGDDMGVKCTDQDKRNMLWKHIFFFFQKSDKRCNNDYRKCSRVVICSYRDTLCLKQIKNTSLKAHQNTSLKAHKNTSLKAHKNTSLKANKNTSLNIGKTQSYLNFFF